MTDDALVARVLLSLERVGFDEAHDPKLQPSLIPVAERWLEHWRALLVESPMSAVGPLASLLASVIHEAQK